MKFIGFNFNKINVERLSNSLEKLKIDTKIDVSSIEKLNNDSVKGNEDIIKANFEYNITYNPEFARINLAGEVFISDTHESIKEIIEEWEKNKTMQESFKVFLFNIILRKGNLKALQLEDEMSFPLHLPLPSIKKEKQ